MGEGCRGRLARYNSGMTARALETVSSSTAAPNRAGRVYFDAELRPNRSLSPTGFFLLMGVIAGSIAALSTVYVNLGAWPVLGFFGLDIVLIVLAFRLSYRQGRLTETVRVTAEDIAVTRRFPSGAATSYAVPTYWARVHIDDPVRHHSQVRVTSQGRTLILGAFLSPDERAAFAKALQAALAQARDERYDPDVPTS